MSLVALMAAAVALLLAGRRQVVALAQAYSACRGMPGELVVLRDGPAERGRDPGPSRPRRRRRVAARGALTGRAPRAACARAGPPRARSPLAPDRGRPRGRRQPSARASTRCDPLHDRALGRRAGGAEGGKPARRGDDGGPRRPADERAAGVRRAGRGGRGRTGPRGRAAGAPDPSAAATQRRAGRDPADSGAGRRCWSGSRRRACSTSPCGCIASRSTSRPGSSGRAWASGPDPRRSPSRRSCRPSPSRS